MPTPPLQSGHLPAGMAQADSADLRRYLLEAGTTLAKWIPRCRRTGKRSAAPELLGSSSC